MTDLNDLKQRLDAAKEQRKPKGNDADDMGPSGLGVGLRIATEMVAALVVGLVIGFYLDKWLGTSPWLLLLFFFLSVAAAFLNAIRTGQELDEKRRAWADAKKAKGQEPDQPEASGWSDEDEEPWRFDQK